MRIHGYFCNLLIYSGLLILLTAIPVIAGDIENASQLIDNGWWEDALGLLDSLIDDNPDNAEANFLLGKLYLFMDDQDNAEKYCKKAVKLNDSNSSYHNRLGQAIGLKAKRGSKFKMYSRGRKARKEFEKAIELAPDNLDARFSLLHFHLGVPGLVGGNKNKVREQADIISQYNPIRGYYARSFIYEDETDGLEQAENELIQAVLMVPSRLESYYRLASFYQRHLEINKAKSAYLRILQIDPMEIKAYYQLGYIYQERKEYNRAITTFERILVIDKIEKAALYQIGRTLLLSEKNLDRAEICFKEYLQSRLKGWWPKRAAAHWRLAMVYDLQGKYDLAVAELEKARKLDSKNDRIKKLLKRIRKKRNT